MRTDGLMLTFILVPIILFHVVSAAMGKAGATLGSAGFKSLFHATNMTVTMLVCAAISLVGLAVTVFFVEDRRGKDMEEGAEEDEGAAP